MIKGSCLWSYLTAALLMGGALEAWAQTSAPRPVPPVNPPAPSGPSSPGKPAVPAPPLLPPGVPPLGLPSDGEPIPSFPDLPDLPNTSAPSLLPPVEGSAGAAEAAQPVENVPPFPPDDVLNPATDIGGELFPPPEPVAPPSSSGSTPPPPPSGSPPPSALPYAAPVWHSNPRKARDIAVGERKCLLLVFANQSGEAGGASHLLSHEVFSSPAFNEYALEHLVLCSLDYSRKRLSRATTSEEAYRLEKALENIKKHFKVRGFPTVILLGPDEKEIARWTGYRSGRAATYFQNLKMAVDGYEAVLFATERRRERLTKQGYRDWRSYAGTTLFAKLVEYGAKHVVLRDENGVDRTVPLSQLAITDREYITRLRLGKPLPQVTPPPAFASGKETTLK